MYLDLFVENIAYLGSFLLCDDKFVDMFFIRKTLFVVMILKLESFVGSEMNFFPTQFSSKSSKLGQQS